MARTRTLLPVQTLRMTKVEYGGCVFWVPEWAEYIGKENQSRVLALDCYPVWDTELRQLRSHLLIPRTRENTRYWYIGTDVESIFEEGTDLVHISKCRKIRTMRMAMREGSQEINKAHARKPLWEREQ